MIFDKKTKITLGATLILGLILGALLFGGSSKEEEKNTKETVIKDQIS